MKNIPFDLRYSPELVVATKTRWSEKFPKDAGQGVLNLMFPERIFTKFANLAHCAVIVDDCLVQFSENGNMYVLDIANNTVSTHCITNNSIPTDLAEWIKNTGSTAVNMMNAIDNSQEAQYFVELYSTILYYHTTNTVSADRYNTAMQKLRKAFGLQPNSDVMRIVNRQWYYGTERKTWGNIALNIFRDYFQSFSTYHR